MKKLFYTYLLLAGFCYGKPAYVTQEETHSLNELINNFKLYTTTNTTFHSGNLYEHSLWVAITVNNWCQENNTWVEGLNEHERTLALLAALLHDMGKAGDLVYSYYTKSEHQKLGQKYMLSKKQYKLSDNKIFNFTKLIESIKFSEIDKQIVSILIAAHHDFGDLLANLAGIDLNAYPDYVKTYIDNFKQRLQEHATFAGYTGPIDTRLMKLALLVSAADVKGSQRCECSHHFSISDLTITTSPKAIYNHATNNFDRFSYPTRGLEIRKLL